LGSLSSLRQCAAQLAALLNVNSVVMHPYIAGEIACGSLSKRAPTLELLQQLPMAPVAEFDEVLRCIEDQKLHGLGIGYVDVHVLVSAAIGGTKLWTRDRRLHAAVVRLGLAYPNTGAH
jgi:predicted nucleic acid-binding protein